MSKESIQGPLSALRNAGTVCGVCLTRESEILVNLFPFSEARIADVVTAIDDIQRYFAQQGKQVDQMSLGYDGGCLCVVEDGEFRLVVMHMLSDEVDFIAKAARAFLADFQLDLFAEQIAAGNTRLDGWIRGNQPPAALMADPPPRSLSEAVGRSGSEAKSSTGSVPDAAPVPESGDHEETSESVPETEIPAEPDSEPQPESEPEIATNARLAKNQPESTLPPPRRPRPLSEP